MKKITSFLLLLFIAVSCSEYNVDTVLPTAESNGNTSRPGPVDPKADPTKLSKVVLFPGQTYEKRLYFYPNGLLKRVANRFGTTYQTYIYDSNNNLTNVLSSNPSVFTYDSNNHITSYNGAPVVYDAAANKYVYHYAPANDYDWPDRREITLNDELLFTHDITYYTTLGDNQDYFYYSVQGLQASYSGGNMTSYIYPTDPSGPSYTHDNKVNPLKAALLPVCRAMSMSYHDFTDGIYNSANNVITNGYGIDDPESDVYEITYNANNLPVSTIVRSYSSGILESTRLDAQYYYQTNTLP